MSKRGRKNERKRKKERERIVRESGCCVPAGSGVLIRWKEVLCVGGCTKRRPIEAAEGRQSLHLTLKRRLRALPGSSPFLLPLSASSPSPFPLRFVRHLFHLLLLVFFFVFARLVNASRRPGRTLHTQLFTSRLFGSSLPPRRRRPPFSPRNADIFNPLRAGFTKILRTVVFFTIICIDNCDDIFRDLAPSQNFYRNSMFTMEVENKVYN